jgi:hypothetical protein
MSAYTISVFDENDVTVAQMPAVAPNAEAALDAAAPWVRQVAEQTGIKPLWCRAEWRKVGRQARAGKPAAASA